MEEELHEIANLPSDFLDIESPINDELKIMKEVKTITVNSEILELMLRLNFNFNINS